MSLTTVFPNNYLPDLMKVAIWVGSGAASSVILLGAWNGASSVSALNWKDVAMWGTFGTIIGAQFGVTGRPWFKNH